jgi:hypothetical protein
MPAFDGPGQLAASLTVDVDSDIAGRLNYALSRGLYDYAAFLVGIQLQRNTSGLKTQLANVALTIASLSTQSTEYFQALNTQLVNQQAAIKDNSSGLTQLATTIANVGEALHGLADVQAKVLRLVERTAWKPKIQFVTITGAKNMGVVIIFDASWSPITDPQNDTQKFELGVSVNGGEPTITEYDRTTSTAVGLEAAAESNVVLSLVAVDASGNRSEADTYSFLAADDVPPPSPTGLGVTVTGQRVDPD